MYKQNKKERCDQACLNVDIVRDSNVYIGALTVIAEINNL